MIKRTLIIALPLSLFTAWLLWPRDTLPRATLAVASGPSAAPLTQLPVEVVPPSQRPKHAPSPPSVDRLPRGRAAEFRPGVHYLDRAIGKAQRTSFEDPVHPDEDLLQRIRPTAPLQDQPTQSQPVQIPPGEDQPVQDQAIQRLPVATPPAEAAPEVVPQFTPLEQAPTNLAPPSHELPPPPVETAPTAPTESTIIEPAPAESEASVPAPRERPSLSDDEQRYTPYQPPAADENLLFGPGGPGQTTAPVTSEPNTAPTTPEASINTPAPPRATHPAPPITEATPPPREVLPPAGVNPTKVAPRVAPPPMTGGNLPGAPHGAMTPPASPPGVDPHAECFSETMFPSAKKCRVCHEQIYEEWAGSSHAYAAISPMFQKFEQTINTLSRGTVGSFCIRCHAPVATWLDHPRHHPIYESTPTALEGVTCVACHRVREAYGKVNGERRIEPGPVYRSDVWCRLWRRPGGGAGEEGLLQSEIARRERAGATDSPAGHPL